MIEIINKDILTVESGVVGHFCNCVGGFGGLAGKIKKKWPAVFEQYKNTIDSVDLRVSLLGTIDITRVDKSSLYVCNMYTQYDYGTNERKTEYGSVKFALRALRSYACGMHIYLPFNCGCGLGGGDWNIVKKIIEKEFDTYNSGTIYICRV